LKLLKNSDTSSALTGELYRSDKSEIIAFRNSLPHGLETFLLEDEFLETVTEIKEKHLRY